MLNRRNLRIKAMQTLFAFHQLRASNKQIARERLKESAKEISHPVIDWEQLDQVFNTRINKSSVPAEELSSEHQELMSTVLTDYQQQVSSDLKYLRAQMLQEVDGIYKLYLWVLGLLNALGDFENVLQSRKKNMAEGKQKTYLKDLRALELLGKSFNRNDLPSWNQHQDRLSQWYKEIKNHPGFAEEWQKGNVELEIELKKLRYVFKSILWKSESFQNFFEEHDRGWVENKDIIKSLVNKTLKSITEEGAVLAPLSYQWDDDQQFFTEIFDVTIKNESWTEKLIADCAKNWEMERIAQVDMILLKMALSEMINFPSIPVKVTINEYIELSKRYSTPKSKKFINGILDVLANDLMAKGTIKKSGRGLIDNK